MEKQIKKRIMKVAEAIAELVEKNGSFEMYGNVLKSADAKEVASFIQEHEDPEEAFWMLHPERDTVILVQNKGQEHSYDMTGSFFVNPSAVQDYEYELERFLDYLEAEEPISSDAFFILSENGNEPEDWGIVRLKYSDEIPADIPATGWCEKYWLMFENSDGYNRGDRRVTDELGEYVDCIIKQGGTIDDATIARIAPWYDGDIRKQIQTASK